MDDSSETKKCRFFGEVLNCSDGGTQGDRQSDLHTMVESRTDNKVSRMKMRVFRITQHVFDRSKSYQVDNIIIGSGNLIDFRNVVGIMCLDSSKIFHKGLQDILINILILLSIIIFYCMDATRVSASPPILYLTLRGVCYDTKFYLIMLDRMHIGSPQLIITL